MVRNPQGEAAWRATAQAVAGVVAALVLWLGSGDGASALGASPDSGSSLVETPAEKGTQMSDPADGSLEGAWIMTEAEGLDLTADRPLGFDVVSGRGTFTGPCETFFGDVTSSDRAIAIGPFQHSGEGFCTPEARQQENALMELLQRVTEFEISAEGELSLMEGGTAKVRARRP